MRIYQSHFDVRDFQVQFLLDYVSDGAIFQSKWSKKNHESLYGETKIPCTVIHNAANHRFFSPPDISAPKNKIKIIGSSWSHQKNKGGDYYDFLEENLDFDRFEMCFAGKTFSKYSKIKSLGILDQKQLGEELKKNHIYFFPSLYEACSNALLEGIASGLVPIVRAGSSNMELVPDSRLYFETHQQALDRLNNIDLNHNYQFLNPHFNAVAKQYVDFAQSIVPKFRELDFTVQSLQLKLKTYSYKFAHMIHRLTEH
jgi:glycosyltransferase involved in cell wall biosynthesis